MIVQHHNLCYSGTCDDLVYYWHPTLKKMLCRKYAVPKISNSNRKLGAISRNIKSLNVSEDFKTDLRIYVAVYALNAKPWDKTIITWSNALNILMHKLAKDFGVDLVILTREQIYSEQLPCISVKMAVEAGLLPTIKGYERLTSAF